MFLRLREKKVKKRGEGGERKGSGRGNKKMTGLSITST